MLFYSGIPPETLNINLISLNKMMKETVTNIMEIKTSCTKNNTYQIMEVTPVTHRVSVPVPIVIDFELLS